MMIILDNYDSFTYNLYQAVAAHVPDVKVLRNDQTSVEEIAALNPEGIIISPGPGRPEAAGISVELVKKLGQKIPILGVCLGHQAIVTAFGGKVKIADEIVHGKDTLVFHQRQGLYQNLSLPFKAGRYHSLIADKEGFPEALMIEAESDHGMVMGMRHREYPIYGVQFHPESILTPEGNQLMKNFVNICLKE